MQPLFHYAFPVHDLAAARAFYEWVDFDLYGHQIVAHLSEKSRGNSTTNPVDGHDVPVPHFGVILTMSQWEELANRLRQAKVRFVIEPYVRFKDQVGEQGTMFFLDPSGNALEFKAFADMNQVFAK